MKSGKGGQVCRSFYRGQNLTSWGSNLLKKTHLAILGVLDSFVGVRKWVTAQMHQCLLNSTVTQSEQLEYQYRSFKAVLTKTLNSLLDRIQAHNFYSCSATLNGELFVFGGYVSKNKQLILLDRKTLNLTNYFRSVRSSTVNWHGLVHSQMHFKKELVEHSYLMATNGSCFVFQTVIGRNASGNNQII